MSAASHLRPQREIPVQFEHRVRRRGRVAERHDEAAFMPAGELSRGGSGVVTTGTPRAMYSTTLVGIECRKFGSSCSSDRPASAPSSRGRASSFGTKP